MNVLVALYNVLKLANQVGSGTVYNELGTS